MKKLAITTAAVLTALAAFYAWGDWVYVGKWGSEGRGNGQFIMPSGLAVAPNGRVYVADRDNQRVQYFSPSGSYLGNGAPSVPATASSTTPEVSK